MSNIAQNYTPLLKSVTRVSISGTKKFVTKERLGEANIVCTGPNFKKYFLNRVERNVRGAVLNIHKLKHDSRHGEILAQLGDMAEIKLAHFFSFTKKKSEEHKISGAINGHAIMAYIEGQDRKLWAINSSWDSFFDCWDIEAHHVGELPGGMEGYLILSCDR